MKFSFSEYDPDSADRELIASTGLFLKTQLWGANDPSEQELDYYRSYYLAVALDDSGRIAAAGAMLGGSSDFYIADMATAAEYRRGHNIGSTVLSMLEHKALSNNASCVRGWALSGAVGFYLRHGYQLADPYDSDNLNIYKQLTTSP